MLQVRPEIAFTGELSMRSQAGVPIGEPLSRFAPST